MANDGHVKIGTELDESGLKKGLSGLGGFAKKGFSAVGGFAVSASKMAIGAIAGIGTAFGGIAMASAKVGMEFEASMSQVAATMGITANTIAEDGTKPFDILSEAAKAAGESTQYSASEAAEALNYLALAGYDAATAAEVLPSVLNLAAAGGMDLAYASDLATDAMSALGIEASNKNLTNFGDQLAVTAQKSNTSVAQLGEAILTVGATAKDLAGGTTELNTALGILADSGIKGSEGGTHLRNVLLSLQSPTDAASLALAKYTNGVYDAEGNMRPLNDILGELNNSLSTMTQNGRTEVINQIFNKTDLAAAQVLLAGCASSVEDLRVSFDSAGIDVNSFGTSIDELTKSFDTSLSQEEYAEKAIKEYGVTSEQAGIMYSGFMSVLSDSGNRFDELSGYINESSGAMQDMADTMNDNLQGDLKILNSALEGFGISIYESVDNPMRDVVQTATSMVGTLSDAFNGEGFSGMTEAGANIIGSLISGAVQHLPDIVGLATQFIGNLKDAFFRVCSEVAPLGGDIISSIVTGMADVVVDISSVGMRIMRDLADSLAESAPQVMEAVGSCIYDIIEGFYEYFPDFVSAGMQLLTNLVSGLQSGMESSIPNIIAMGAEMLTELILGIAETLPDLIEMAVDIVIGLAEALTDPNTLINLVNAGIKLLENLVTGLGNAAPKLIAAAPKIIANLATALIASIPRLLVAAGNIMLSIGKFLIQSIGNLLKVIPEIFRQMVSKFKTLDWGSIGTNLIDGIKEGILSKASEMIEAVIESAKKAIEGVKEFLGIHSPSRLARDVIGKNLIDGIGIGIEQQTPKLIAQSQESMGRLIAGIKAKSYSVYPEYRQEKATKGTSDADKENHSGDTHITLKVVLEGDAKGIFRVVSVEEQKFFDTTGKGKFDHS